MIVENWWRFRLSFENFIYWVIIAPFINIRVNFMLCSLWIFMIIESETSGYLNFWKKGNYRRTWWNFVFMKPIPPAFFAHLYVVKISGIFFHWITCCVSSSEHVYQHGFCSQACFGWYAFTWEWNSIVHSFPWCWSTFWFWARKKRKKKREISIYIGGNQNVFMIHDFLFSSRLNMMVNLEVRPIFPEFFFFFFLL